MSAQESKKRPAAKGGRGSKAGTRSSKTDHVLNLLGGGHTAQPPEEPAGQAAPAEQAAPAGQAAPAEQAASAKQTAPAGQAAQSDRPAPAAQGAESAAPPVQPQPPASPVLTAPAKPSLPILEVARNNNQRLADTICSALEQALAEEEGHTPPPAEPEPVKQEPEPVPEPVPEPAAPEPQPEPEPEPASPEPQPEPKPEPVAPEPQPEPEPEPASPEPQPKPEPEPAPPEPQPEPVKPEPEPETPPAQAEEPKASSAPRVSNSVAPAPAEEESLILPGNALYLNVMELLVDEAMERYGKATGLCSCARCRADAKALTLSRLPAKYVVLPAPAMPPMISLYREEFSSDVLAQILYSCNKVKENPRHPQGSV